jgi:hypothetical protein
VIHLRQKTSWSPSNVAITGAPRSVDQMDSIISGSAVTDTGRVNAEKVFGISSRVEVGILRRLTMSITFKRDPVKAFMAAAAKHDQIAELFVSTALVRAVVALQ